MISYHYLYAIADRKGRVYIGSRTSNKKPIEDISYIGSFTDERFVPYRKMILKVCKSAAEHRILERELITFLFLKTKVPLVNKAIPLGSRPGYILLWNMNRQYRYRHPLIVRGLVLKVKRFRRRGGKVISSSEYRAAAKQRSQRFGLKTARRGKFLKEYIVEIIEWFRIRVFGG